MTTMKYEEVIAAWNNQADGANDWTALGEDEKIEFAMIVTADQMRAYAAAAVEAEREACARAVEQYGGAWDEATQAFARLIRARSTASNSAKAKSAEPPAPRAPSDLCR